MSDDPESESSQVAEEAVTGELPIDLSEFLDSIADLDDELHGEAMELRAYLENLEEALDEAEAEIDDLTSRLKRAHADFENYKKRVKRRQDEERREATQRLVDRLLDVRENLRRSLNVEDQSLEDLREGVSLTLRDVDRLLDAEDVQQIDPEVGEPVDPHLHEVMLRVESDQPADTIAEVFEPGYRHGDTVLREAKVSVSEGSADEPEHEDESAE